MTKHQKKGISDKTVPQLYKVYEEYVYCELWRRWYKLHQKSPTMAQQRKEPKSFRHRDSPGPRVKSAALNCSSTVTAQMRTSHLTNFTVCRPSPFLIVL